MSGRNRLFLASTPGYPVQDCRLTKRCRYSETRYAINVLDCKQAGLSRDGALATTMLEELESQIGEVRSNETACEERRFDTNGRT